MRRWLIALFVLACLVVGIWWALPTIKLPDNIKDWAEYYAASKLGRPVTIGSLRANSKNPLYIEITDLRVANPVWAGTRDMVRIDHLKATLELWPLLKHTVRFDDLTIDGLQVMLERDGKGIGNWKPLDDDTPPTVKPPEELHDAAEESRPHIPVVLKLVVQNSRVTYRTSSGQILKIDLKNVALNAADSDTPATLKTDGAYNGIPVHLDVDLHSFDELRDGGRPFHADITALGAGGAVKLSADMMDPLNFDNFTGALDARFENLGAMAKIFGADFRADMPIGISSQFRHDDMVWNLDGMTGNLGDSRLKGDLQLDEAARDGGRLPPDHVRATLDFDRVNVDEILKQTRARRTLRHDRDEPIFHVERNPGMLLDARLGAGDFAYKSVQLKDLKFLAVIDAGADALKDVSADFLGGRIKASLNAVASGDSSGFTAQAEIRNADLAQLFHLLGIERQVISGPLSLRADMATQGESEDAMKRNASGTAVVSMTDGAVSRKVMEQVSVDLRGLFGFAQGESKLSCLLAVAGLKNGVMTVTPFRMKTADGVLFGGGWVNWNADTVAFQFRTNPQSTGFLALNVPISISGNLDRPAIKPLWKSNLPGLRAEGQDNVWQLSPDMHAFIEGNGCRE